MIYQDLGMTKEELLDFINCMDEIDDYKTKIRKDFYILKEREEGKAHRVIFKDLNKVLPVNDIKNGNLNNVDRDSAIIQVEGDFYPEIIEENGLYFLSTPLYQYIKNKIDFRVKAEIVVGLASEKGRRMEEYHLIIPYELDCIIEGTEKYSKAGELVYFEIDDPKTGEMDIFKVKGFPHLIITQKVNRLEYGGIHCSRIENYFDYEGERDKVYQKRVSGEKLEAAYEEYEKIAKSVNKENTLQRIKSICNKEVIRRDIKEGLKSIFESYIGKEELSENFAERILVFFYSWKNSKIYLAKTYEKEYEKTEINLGFIRELKEYSESLPEELKEAGEKIGFETLLHCFAAEGNIFDKYDKIHNEQRFRIYLHNEYFKSMNAPMVYDYKSDFQKETEGREELTGHIFKNIDLREFDFSGKDMRAVKIEGCNLRRAKFKESILEEVEFINCDLTGADFSKSRLKNAKFIDCKFDRVNFDYAKMSFIEIKGSDLCHSSFIKSDLTNAKVVNKSLSKAYFYKSKLVDAIFEIPGKIFNNVFYLSDLKRVKFLGDKNDYLSCFLKCDFRKCDLSGSEFIVESINESKFIKANLDGATFYVDTIMECDFKWASCFMINLEHVNIRYCNFNWVDLSNMKVMKNISFVNNDLSYTDLSTFDFQGKLFGKNKLIYTKLKNCNLKKMKMKRNELMFPDLEGADLEGAVFRGDQLEYVKLSQKQAGEIEVLKEEGDNNG